MTLRIRVLLLAVLLGTVLIAAAIAVLDTLDDEAASRALVVERIQPADNAARSLLTGLVNQESGVRGYVITGDEAFLDTYESGQQQATRALQSVWELVGGNARIAAQVLRVRASAERWRSLAAEPEIAARRRGDVGGAQAIVASGAGKARFDRLRGEVDRLQRLIDERVRAAGAAAAADADDLREELLVVAALLVLLALAALVLIRRWVLVPLRSLQMGLRGVSAGDLTRRIEPTGPPETRALAEDAEGMRRRILDELEASEGARQALEQRGPVVAGLRRQLEPVQRAAPPGLAVAGALHAAEGVLAGDWYDVLPLPGGATALVLVDVSGHGAEAGLVALRLKHVLSAALRLGLPPEDALAMAAEDFDDARERFATCVIVELDPRSGVLRWSNAGHPPPLIVARAGIAGELGPTGPLLASIGGEWRGHETRLRAGDLVLAYTDGLTESRADGEELGVERVRQTLEGLDEVTADAAVDACLAAARDHAREDRRDDITIVAVQLLAMGVAATPAP